MTMHMRRLGLSRYTQTELAKDATRAVGRDPDRLEEKDWVISQAGVSLILTNQVSESPASIAFALVFGVEAAWLQYGIGPKSYLDRLLEGKASGS